MVVDLFDKLKGKNRAAEMRSPCVRLAELAIFVCFLRVLVLLLVNEALGANFTNSFTSLITYGRTYFGLIYV